MVVSSLLTEAGFESAEKASVETLTEMLQSCEYREILRLLSCLWSSFRNSYPRYCPPFSWKAEAYLQTEEKIVHCSLMFVCVVRDM